MQKALEQLCELVPEALGAAVCDADGESLALAIGAADFPECGWELIRTAMPRQFAEEHRSLDESKQFVLRQWAAEPSRSSGILNRAHLTAGASEPSQFSLRFDEFELLVHVMVEQMYVVLVVRRPCVTPIAARYLAMAGARLGAMLTRDLT